MDRSQRWKRRKEARPAELLDAALAEFFDKGFEAARLEDIATRAGVSKGTIYLYFDSKEDIFEALVQAIPQPNIEALGQVISDQNVPADALLARALRFIALMLRDERIMKFPRLIIGEAGRFPKLAETYKNEIIAKGVALVASIIERGIGENVFRTVQAQHAAYAAISGLLFVAIWRTTFERFDATPLDVDAFVEQHISNFLRGLRVEGQP